MQKITFMYKLHKESVLQVKTEKLVKSFYTWLSTCKKVLIWEKKHLYTDLYTLSTKFYVNSVEKIMVTIRINVLYISNKMRNYVEKNGFSLDIHDVKNRHLILEIVAKRMSI
jgi:hypothetical protein